MTSKIKTSNKIVHEFPFHCRLFVEDLVIDFAAASLKNIKFSFLWFRFLLHDSQVMKSTFLTPTFDFDVDMKKISRVRLFED